MVDDQTSIPRGVSNWELFAGMDAGERSEVFGLARRCELEPGAILFHEGEPAANAYMVVKGSLKLSRLHEDGTEMIVRYIQPGETVAEITVCDGKEYPVTAQAVGSCETVGWDRDRLLSLLRDHPQLAINMLRAALERVNDLQGRYMELRAERVEQRIARALLRIMQQSGRPTDEGIEIGFRLSRQDLADYTGTTLYTVSRTLSGWEKKGWIRSGRERIVVVDPHAMVTFSETG